MSGEIVGAILLSAWLVALTASAWLAAACFRFRSATEFLVAVYVLAWAWLVLVTLALSPPALVTRGWLVAGVGVGLATSVVAWQLSGRPAPPPFRPALAAIAPRALPPVVAILAAATLLGLAYTVALALLTPANEGDSLSYHLARAAFWRQAEQVGHIPGAVDPRLNVHLPNAEIAQLVTMVLSGSDRYVALPQLLSYAALVLCVAGLARRAGLAVPEALFGALVFATLPVVVVQAPGALNDLVVASFLAAATLFLFGTERRSLALVALAVGLALGTKLTAVIALPTLALVAAVATPVRRWPGLALAGVAGLAWGSVWYILNVVETGELDGGLAEDAAQRVPATFAAISVNALRLVLDLLDLSGAQSPMAVVYVGAGLVVAALGVVRRRGSRSGACSFLFAGALTAAVLALPLAADLGRSFVFRAWVALGEPPTAPFERGWGLNLVSDPIDSWYGPLGLLLLVPVALAVALARNPPRSVRVPAVLALAPWLLLLTLAATVVWDPGRGRFLVFGVALAAATWGYLLRSGVAAAAVTATAVVTLGLALLNNQGKPSGIGELVGVENPFGISVSSIWSRSRVEAQTILRPGAPERELFTAVERTIPERATVAVVPRPNDYLFPFFGKALARRVTLVRPGEPPPESRWLVLAPGTSPTRCAGAWRREVTQASGWRIERRVRADSCPEARPTHGAMRRARPLGLRSP